EIRLTTPEPWLREFEVEIEPDRLKTRVHELLSDYRNRAEVPGFRKGHVPLEVLERRLGDALEQTAAEELIKDSLPDVLAQYKLRPATAGRVRDLEITPAKAIRFRYSIEVIPEFELKPYTGLKLRRPEFKDFDQEFERRLEALRQKCATFRSIPRAAQTGDFAVIDYQIWDGETQVGKTRSNVMVEVGSDENMPEINAALAGVQANEQREAQIIYPPDYADKTLAGKMVTYRLQVRDIKERLLPEVNNDFCHDLGFENMDDLRESINNDILADRERLAEVELKNQVFNHLVTEHDFEPPASWVESSLERLRSEYELPDDAQTRERLRPIARKWARFDCIVARIAEQENIVVTDEEIAEQSRLLAEQSGQPIEEVSKVLDTPYYRNRALREKVIKWIIERADID
ncbi:MAG: trigger factor, partial [candidate division WOR-3 bacterium]